MRIFTTEFTGSHSYHTRIDTDFTVDFSGGTRRGRRVPLLLYTFLSRLSTKIHINYE